MTDFRTLVHHLAALRVTPTPEEYYLDGYSMLRECMNEAQTILQTPFSGNAATGTGNLEYEKRQLQA